MKEISYFLMKIQYRIRGRDKEVASNYFRKMGMKIGKGCNICDNITTNEPYLIEIGDNVTTSAGVTFVTHDNSVSKVIPNCTDIFGKIVIGNNCFLGSGCMILYGVTIPNNVIVAAGSVVTKSIDQENVIVAGNPAKVISTWDSFSQKMLPYVWNLDLTSREVLIESARTEERLIRR